MRGTAGGPSDILEAVYDKYAGELYRYALMILADKQSAEDAVQEAFMKTLGRGRHTREIEAYDRYLRRAVRNECYRMIRRRRGAKEIELPWKGAMLEAADGSMVDEGERRALEGALRRLPTDQREVLYLKVYQGKTLREIGEMVGVSVNTAGSRYRYAMDKLREMMPGADK